MFIQKRSSISRLYSCCSRPGSAMDWIGLCSVLRPHQHSICYIGDGFTGQKTQPTVSKYWRKTLQRKTQKNQTTENAHI